MPFPISALRVARLRLQPIGEGTERVEEEARRRFPSARVLRVDGETMRRPKQAAAIWSRIQRREWDVLVGTQLVLRHDVVPPVGLVGVVQADAGLARPDFRAAERAGHLLHDAIGFAQPLSMGGRNHSPNVSPLLIIRFRRWDNRTRHSSKRKKWYTEPRSNFLPAVHLIVLHVSGPQEETVERAAQT